MGDQQMSGTRREQLLQGPGAGPSPVLGQNDKDSTTVTGLPMSSVSTL